MTRKPLTYRQLELCEICHARKSTGTDIYNLTGMAVPQACVTLGALERDGVLRSFKRGAERLFFPTESGLRKMKRAREWWAGREYRSQRKNRDSRQ